MKDMTFEGLMAHGAPHHLAPFGPSVPSCPTLCLRAFVLAVPLVPSF